MGKKDWVGVLFFISGVILYGFTSVGAIVLMPDLEEWNTPPGRYWSAVQQGYLLFPMIFSWVLMGLGIVLIFWGELKNMYKRLSH